MHLVQSDICESNYGILNVYAGYHNSTTGTDETGMDGESRTALKKGLYTIWIVQVKECSNSTCA